jgi:hypothetical protein
MAATISFTSAIRATSSSKSTPSEAPAISLWEPNRSLSARASRSTDTSRLDEAFYVLEGGGTFILNDQPHPFEKGGTIFIPKTAWHGFANPDQELLLLWIVAPPGLDGFFRETCNPPGVPRKQLTKDQVNEIARKYATEFR